MHRKSVIDNQVKNFPDKQFTVDGGTSSEEQKVIDYGLPHINQFSHVTKKKLKHICEDFCKDIVTKIAFSPLHLSSFFSSMEIYHSSKVVAISIQLMPIKSYILFCFLE